MPDASRIAKLIVGLAVVAAVIIAFRVLPVADWLRAFQAYVRGIGPIGYVVYALVYAVCCVLFIPASLLTLGAGAIFGLAAGTAVVVAGATLGATLAFLLARTVLRERIQSMTANNAKFRALDRAIAKEGGRIVLLVRLAPVFPFTYSNYAFGLTGIRTLPYVLATLAGIIPGTFAFVYIGSAAATAASGSASNVKLAVYIVGAIATVAASVFVARVAMRAIRRAGVEE